MSHISTSRASRGDGKSAETHGSDRLKELLSGMVGSHREEDHHTATVQTSIFEEDEESRTRVPKGFIRVKIVHNKKEREEVVDAAELAHLRAQQQAALRELRRTEDLFTVPEWVRLHPLLGAYLAEAIGTFAWVLTVSLAKSSVQQNVFVLDATASMDMLPTGLMLSAMIFGLGYISGGHFNPAVSFAVFLSRSISFSTFMAYLLIQLAAALGAGVFGMLALSDSDIFVPTVDTDYISSGLFSELIFTLAIALVALHTRYSRQQCNFYYACAVGMTVAAGSACAGRISGGSFNPAAATGLQAAKCFAGDCDSIKMFWVYWVAPLIGAGVASALFSQIDDSDGDSRIFLRDEHVVPPQIPPSQAHSMRRGAVVRRHRRRRRVGGSASPEGEDEEGKRGSAAYLVQAQQGDEGEEGGSALTSEAVSSTLHRVTFCGVQSGGRPAGSDNDSDGPLDREGTPTGRHYER